MALQWCAAGREVASVTIVDVEALENDGILGCEYNRQEMFMQLAKLLEQGVEGSLNLVASDFEGLNYSAQLELLHNERIRKHFFAYNTL